MSRCTVVYYSDKKSLKLILTLSYRQQNVPILNLSDSKFLSHFNILHTNGTVHMKQNILINKKNIYITYSLQKQVFLTFLISIQVCLFKRIWREVEFSWFIICQHTNKTLNAISPHKHSIPDNDLH